MAAKKQTAFRLSDEILEYLKAYKEENHLSSITNTLELIIHEHQELNLRQNEVIANSVVEKIESKYGNAFTRIRLATRTADINSQIMIEIMNSILNSDIDAVFVPTDILKHDIVEKSEDKIQARIAYYKQKNDDKKKGKKNKEMNK